MIGRSLRRRSERASNYLIHQLATELDVRRVETRLHRIVGFSCGYLRELEQVPQHLPGLEAALADARRWYRRKEEEEATEE